MRENRGVVSGALVLTIFGALWALPAVSYFPAPLVWIALGVAVLVTLVLLGLCAWRWRTSPLTAGFEQDGAGSHTRLSRFGSVVSIEGLAILVASIALSRSEHITYIAPVVSVIVGLHFFPLAALFSMRAYYLTAVLFVFPSTGAIVAQLLGVTLGAPENWHILIGIFDALVLWLTAAAVLAAGTPVNAARPMPDG